MKKGIERIMRGRPWQEVMFLAERVCGICSVIHNMVFIEAMETDQRHLRCPIVRHTSGSS